MIRVGIVGLGYWGPNLVRCFNELPNCKVTAVCDRSVDQLLKIKDRFPAACPYEDFEAMLQSQTVDAVVIATPTSSHFHLAMLALEMGIHVFVEKPLAETSEMCEKMIRMAETTSTTLFVGHIFLHSSPVAKLRSLIDEGELGRINYISSRRLNLGPIRQDVSALYDLGTHDISMMLYLLGDRPLQVSCTGIDLIRKGNHDVVNLSMLFPNKRMGIVHVSWIDPCKERVLTVVGDRKMAVYNDLDQEKIKIYDKGITTPMSTGDFADFQISYRHGGSYSPFLNEKEPLKAECAEFIRCIISGEKPITNGQNGKEVVEVLEAANESLLNNGKPVSLHKLGTQETEALREVIR